MPISLGQNIGTLLKSAASGLIQSILPKPKEEESTGITSRESFESGDSAFITTSLENQTPQVQRMVESWLQLDPKSLSGLEKFIEVQFQHSPENSEMFLKFQVMKMLKDARQAIEQNELAVSAKSKLTDENAKLLNGASFFGSSFLKKLGRRPKVSAHLSNTLSVEDGEPIFEEGLQAAFQFLKQAESELQKAMNQSDNPDSISNLLDQIGSMMKSIEFLLARKTLLKKIPA